MFKKLCECVLCSQPTPVSELFCESCESDYRKRLEPRHGSQEAFGDFSYPLLWASRYEGANRAFVRLLKTQPWNAPSAEFRERLAKIAHHWKNEVATLKPSAVIPVPSHPVRRRLQTDMSLLWGCEVSRALGLPLFSQVLDFRINLQGLRFQKLLNRRERMSREVSSRFKLVTPKRKLGPVLLVDDVCATGASLRGCARLLEGSGIRVCGAFVFARALAQTPPSL